MAASSRAANRPRSAPMPRCARPISASTRRRVVSSLAERVLHVEAIETCYGLSQVLKGIWLNLAGPWTLDKVCTLFPRLADRINGMGNQLSGGEQQMLAIGRALMTNPRLLILDEATEGLAPLIRAEIWQCLTRLKSQSQAILVIDKNVEALTRIADRHYLIERGKVVWTGSSRELVAAPGV